MDPIGSGQPRHILHATAGAFNLNSGGTPTSFKFGYGTYGVAASGVEEYGIITDCTISSLAEKANLRDGVGSTFGLHMRDPGWQATFSLMVDISKQAPSRGSVIAITPNVDERAGADTYLAVITDLSFKWTQEGWRTFEITAEARDSMNIGETFGVTVTDAGVIGDVIYTPPMDP